MDLTTLSDEQLNALEKAQKAPLSQLSDEELGHLEAAHSGKPQAGVTEDVVKSSAIGPVKAGLGMVGAIPAIAGTAKEAANKYLFDPLFNAISGPPKQGPQTPNIIGGTGPADINKLVGTGLGNVESKLYEPKTPYGRYGQSITEAGTGAALGPGGLMMKVGQALGAGLGSEFAASQAPDWFKPYARFLGGVGGGVAATGAGAGVEALRNINAAQVAGKDISSVIGGPQLKYGAVKRVGQNIADEGLTPQEVAAKTAALGPNAMVLDLGHQLEARADYMAQHPGQASTTIYKPIAERAEGIAPQLNAVLDKHMGPSQDIVKLQNGIDAWSQQNVTPLYKNLEQKYPIVHDPILQDLAERPSIANAMKGAETIAKDMGQTLPKAPDIRYWDFVKKSLDQRITNMLKGSDSSAQQSTTQAVMQARRDLVDHLDRLTGGEYAQARKLAATKPAMEDAVELGRSMFNSKALPEQWSEQLGNMSIPERRMVEIGVRREIENRVGTPGDEGRKLRALIGAPNNSDKLQRLLGSQANTEIQNEVAAANQFQSIKNKIEGTRTATRLAGMADTTAAQVNPSDIITAPARLPTMALNYLLQHGMAGTRQDISRILTAKGGQIDPVVNMLMNYNKQRAANAATPLGQQASTLIRALMAQRAAGG